MADNVHGTLTQRHPLASRLAALGAGLLLAVLAGEIAARVAGPAPAPRPWPAAHHPLLGYVPRPGYRSRAGAPCVVSIEADGVRSNGAPRPPGRPLVAAGDSFTFGDEVADEHSWPAALERELGVPVLNAGVGGYGFDQTVLRAETLLAGRRARGLIVSLILDDVRRCQYSVLNGAPKPWFEAVEGRLELRNVPVPVPLAARPLLGALLRRSRLVAWTRQAFGATERAEHDRGLEVTRLLIRRLGATARGGLPVLLVFQGPPPGPAALAHVPRPTFPVLGGLERTAQDAGLPALNLVTAAWQEVQARPQRRGELFLRDGAGHMTPAGNAWVAARVARRLRALGLPGG